MQNLVTTAWTVVQLNAPLSNPILLEISVDIIIMLIRSTRVYSMDGKKWSTYFQIIIYLLDVLLSYLE